MLPRSWPPGAKTLPVSDEMGRIPATKALGCRWVPIRRLRKTSVTVVGHIYRVIYINSPSDNLKNLEICPDRDPREPKPFSWGSSRYRNLGPSAKNLVYIHTKVDIWFITVVWCTCRVIHITSLTILPFFLEITVAIDIYEGSILLAQEIIIESIPWSCTFLSSHT